jgi:catechol 2,3-dioxygenase-like lactoylglutathione lyase family enzyme
VTTGPIRTYGLTHVALAVKDARRSLEFYQRVFGVVPVYENPGFIQAQTPGARDVLVFEEGKPRAGDEGGIMHFGFRLANPADIERAVEAIEAAGGRVIERGDFCPGEPYVFFADPDGYTVELWHELPTPVDPRS